MSVYKKNLVVKDNRWLSKRHCGLCWYVLVCCVMHSLGRKFDDLLGNGHMIRCVMPIMMYCVRHWVYWGRVVLYWLIVEPSKSVRFCMSCDNVLQTVRSIFVTRMSVTCDHRQAHLFCMRNRLPSIVFNFLFSVYVTYCMSAFVLREELCLCYTYYYINVCNSYFPSGLDGPSPFYFHNHMASCERALTFCLIVLSICIWMHAHYLTHA